MYNITLYNSNPYALYTSQYIVYIPQYRGLVVAGTKTGYDIVEYGQIFVSKFWHSLRS